MKHGKCAWHRWENMKPIIKHENAESIMKILHDSYFCALEAPTDIELDEGLVDLQENYDIYDLNN